MTCRRNELILQLDGEGRELLTVRHENSGLDLKTKLDHFPFITAMVLHNQMNQDQTTQFELLSEWSPVPVLTAVLASQQKQWSKDLMGGIQGNFGVDRLFSIVLQWNWNFISYFSKVTTNPAALWDMLSKRVQVSFFFPSKTPPKLWLLGIILCYLAFWSWDRCRPGVSCINNFGPFYISLRNWCSFNFFLRY